MGFLLLSVSFVLIPFARTPVTLILFRLIADYSQNASRGKLISINGVVTGLGVVLLGALVFTQLPAFFAGRGAAPTVAGTYAFLVSAAAAAFSALVAGMLFDAWMYQAPFVNMAVLNLLICIGAIAVRVYYGKSVTGAAEPSLADAAALDAGQANS